MDYFISYSFYSPLTLVSSSSSRFSLASIFDVESESDDDDEKAGRNKREKVERKAKQNLINYFGLFSFHSRFVSLVFPFLFY